MNETTNGLLSRLLRDRPGLAVLCIGSMLEFHAPWQHEGRLAVIGPRRPPEWAAADFSFLLAPDAAAVLQQLHRLIDRGDTFDVILVDHDHRLMALHDQILLALQLAHPDTLFLFDDAVPPSHEMATPVPGKGWWCGQVWLLRALLQPLGPDALLACLAMPPTGLLAARGFAMAPEADFRAMQSRAPASDAELAALTRPLPLAALEPGLIAAMDRLETRHHLVLEPGGDDMASAVRVLEPGLTLDRRPAAFIGSARPDGSLPEGIERLEQLRRHPHERRLYTHDNALLLGFDCILQGNRIATRQFDPKFDAHTLRNIAAKFGRYENAGTGIRLDGERIVLEAARLANPSRIPGHVLLATADEPMNYGMWLLMVLPAAFEFLRHRDRYDRLLCHCPQPWQKAMLRAAGVDMADVIEHDPRAVHLCARISVPRYGYRDLWLHEAVRRDLDRLGPAPQRTGRRVFLSRLSRARAGGYRALMNEDELVAGMAGLGFEIVEPETMAFPDQIRLFRETSVLVGLGGAGMFNAVFCPPGSKVVTIESSAVFVDAHVNLLASAGHEHGVLFGLEDPDDPRPSQKRWTVDVDRVLRAVADFAL